LLPPSEESVALEELGSMALKGITQPVSIFNVLDQQATGASAEVIPLQRPVQQPR
jgi:class 3 adenylate cyclase